MAETEKYDLPAWRRFLPSRRTSTRALAFGGVAALAFAVFLQAQLSNLRGDKDQLQDQLSAASSELEQQRQIVAGLVAPQNPKGGIGAAVPRAPAQSGGQPS